MRNVKTIVERLKRVRDGSEKEVSIKKLYRKGSSTNDCARKCREASMIKTEDEEEKKESRVQEKFSQGPRAVAG